MPENTEREFKHLSETLGFHYSWLYIKLRKGRTVINSIDFFLKKKKVNQGTLHMILYHHYYSNQIKI